MTAPCHGSFAGRSLDDTCDDCSHPLMLHSANRTCSICGALEGALDDTAKALADTMRAEFREIVYLLVNYVALATARIDDKNMSPDLARARAAALVSLLEAVQEK